MIVAFDASVLVYILDASARAPVDPKTGVPVESCSDRVTHLIRTLEEKKARIVVPTPSLAEVLVRAGDATTGWLDLIRTSKHFHIAPFCPRAAVEYAAMEAERVQRDQPRIAATRAKAKFDAQIVSIAAVERAQTIYSDDSDIATLAGGRIEVVGVLSLPLPPVVSQPTLPFDA